jgi:ornithine cyclodeaminase
MTSITSPLYDAEQTAQRLPYPALVHQLRALLQDASVQVPQRTVLPLASGGSLFLMPALDQRVAITKLITYTPANAGTGKPTIQGDVVVFDVTTGERSLVLDGPTVTARRTAAVSLLAAQALAPNPQGPLLIVGAGVQGRSHLEAFAQNLPAKEVLIASRSEASAEALAKFGRALGLRASVVRDPNSVVDQCPLIVSCTPATGVVLSALPRPDAFIAAVGAFTPSMAELAPELCRYCEQHGIVVLDTPDAAHEAGDLIQAGLDLTALPDLRKVCANDKGPARGPVLFKSCGWAGWDLAAARAAIS